MNIIIVNIKFIMSIKSILKWPHDPNHPKLKYINPWWKIIILSLWQAPWILIYWLGLSIAFLAATFARGPRWALEEANNWTKV